MQSHTCMTSRSLSFRCGFFSSLEAARSRTTPRCRQPRVLHAHQEVAFQGARDTM